MGFPAVVDVVIIGAGQAGLSVAYYLQRLGLVPGVDQLVVDRGPGPGGSWQHRWEALRLGSAHRVHDLPGMHRAGIGFESADRSRPAREVVAEYYARYEAFYGLAVQRPVTVSAVYDRGAQLVVRTAHTEVVTRALVNATGTWGAPFIPYYAGLRDFAGPQVHTSSYVDARELAGRRVLVVGGGTSAIGFLLELEGVAAHTVWVTRRPPEFLDQGAGEASGLDLASAVNAVDDQDAAARAGRALPSVVSGTRVPLTRRIAAAIERGVLTPFRMFERLEPHAAVWSDGHREPIDAIVWATGFRPDVRHLSPLRLHEKAGGIAVTASAAERDARIFFAGYGPTASTIGANRAGRTIARQVYAALGAPDPLRDRSRPPSHEAAPEPEDHVDELMSRFFTDA